MNSFQAVDNENISALNIRDIRSISGDDMNSDDMMEIREQERAEKAVQALSSSSTIEDPDVEFARRKKAVLLKYITHSNNIDVICDDITTHL